MPAATGIEVPRHEGNSGRVIDDRYLDARATSAWPVPPAARTGHRPAQAVRRVRTRRAIRRLRIAEIAEREYAGQVDARESSADADARRSRE